MIITSPYTYKKIKQVNLPDRRVYDVGESRMLPSVTTILSATKSAESKQALDDWKARVGKEESERITNQSSTIGSEMHDNLEKWILNKEKPAGTVMSKMLTKLIINNGLKHVDEVWGTEVPLYYPELYAGTTDLVGIHKGTPAIIDFKNSRQNKLKEYVEDYYLQLTAYALAHNKLYNTNINKGVIMMACHSGNYMEFIIEDSEFEMWTNKWLERVSLYYSN